MYTGKHLNFISCSHIMSEYSSGVSDLEQTKIDSIITNNNRTIIYLWTEWCYGSRQHFMEDVVPYLQQKSDTIGFISIFYGSEEVLDSILMKTQCDYPIFRIKSLGGLDKNRMYKLLNLFLKDYKQMNYVPVSLICDKNGNILNYDNDKKRYSHIIDCILSVNEDFKSVNITYDTIKPTTQ